MAFVALSVGLVLQPGEKWGIRSFGLGVAGRRLPRRWILVLGFFRPAPLPLWARETVVRCARGWCSSTVCSLRAKRAFASLSAISAEGRPASLIKVGSRVVLHTGRTPRAANMIALYTILTRPPSLVLTSMVALFFLRWEGLVRPAYQASVLYSAEESTQVITAF
jgi:hypothetical protein